MSSDDLAGRAGLPEPYRYLVEALPRDQWSGQRIAAMARFWLQRHAAFRAALERMNGLNDRWRAGGVVLPELHRQLIPELQAFLQHLDGHHTMESRHYFPTMRQVEPRIGTGIDLLDRDHDAIHGRLEGLFQSALAFHQALAANDPAAKDAAERLADDIRASGPILVRHLDDEEDIVVPLITRHADVFTG